MLVLALPIVASVGCRPPSDDDPGTDTGATGGGGGGPEEVPGDDGDPAALFPADRVVEVALTLAEDDWRALRAEAPSWFARYDGADCLDAPYDPEHDDHAAAGTLDGVRFTALEVRGEDGWRHADAERPSLRIDVDPDGAGVRLHGLRRLHLHNLARDPGAVSTCAVLHATAALGLPAARCALAHVTVNGEDLGVYAHVEDTVRDVLPARYGEDLGVYAGDDADFREGWSAGFDPVGDGTDPEAPAVAALTAALAEADADLLAAVGAVADVDALAAGWAAEVLFEQTGGYSAARGPVWVVAPAEGGVVLVSAAPDVALGAAPPADPLAYTGGAVASRLAEVAPERLTGALGAALAAWDDAATAEDVDRLAALARPLSTVDADAFEDAVATAGAFVAGRRAVLEAALADAALTGGEEPPSPCLVEDGGITLTFTTTWGSGGEDPEAYGECTVATVQGQSAGGAVADATPAGAAYTLGWSQAGDDAVAGFVLDALPAGPGAFPLGDRADAAWLRVTGEEGARYWVLRGGELVLTAQGDADGDVVAGWFAGVRYQADAWAPPGE